MVSIPCSAVEYALFILDSKLDSYSIQSWPLDGCRPVLRRYFTSFSGCASAFKLVGA